MPKKAVAPTDPGSFGPSAKIAGEMAPPPPVMQQGPSVKAGEWDDNANYREFQKWILSEQGQGFHRRIAALGRAGVGHAGHERQPVDQLAAGGPVVAGAQAVDDLRDQRGGGVGSEVQHRWAATEGFPVQASGPAQYDAASRRVYMVALPPHA